MSQSANAGKKVLLVVSSATPEFWLGKFHTGFFFTEVLHPYLTYKNHGYHVDIVSENGKGAVDVNSIPYAQIDGESRRAYNDKDHEIWQQLNHLKSASEVNAGDYEIVFYAGGHGASYDFPKATTLQEIGSKIYGSGGVIGSVCHGPAIFCGMKDPKSGDLLIKGKKVTAFSERGEMMMTATPVMKAQGIPSMREYMEQAGANWQEPTMEHMNPMASYVVEDGRIVTGTTPMAAADIAQRTVELAHPGEQVEDKRPAKSIL